MTPGKLIDELQKFIKEAVENYYLETNTDNYKAPQVLRGYLPPKKTTPEPDYPYILIRLLGGKDQAFNSNVRVKLIIGTYSQDIDGRIDTENIVEHIRQALLSTEIIGNMFQLEYPVEWELYEEQPYPEWIGTITTQWTIARPQKIKKELV